MAGSADKTGSAQNKSPSASTFLSTLIPVLLIVAVILSVFLILRPKYKRVYEPRTYLPLLRK
jgi:preprotein translocase subunit YajC